jgi:hypothetical protein
MTRDTILVNIYPFMRVKDTILENVIAAQVISKRKNKHVKCCYLVFFDKEKGTWFDRIHEGYENFMTVSIKDLLGILPNECHCGSRKN